MTDLCPPTVCDPRPPESLGQALRDAAVVYGHRTLPADWREELPSIDESWGSFGECGDTGSGSRASRDGDEPLTGQALVTEAYTKWRELGATHIAVATHNAGLSGADAHLRAAARYLAAVRAT